MEGFPKTKYPKQGGGSAMVTSPEQEKALGPDWQDYPPPELPKPKEKPSQLRKI